MILRETFRKGTAGKEEEIKSLDIDSFGKMMDGFIHKSEVGLAVHKKEDSDDWEIMGAGLGAVLDFYIYLHGLEPIFRRMVREMARGGLPIEAEKFAGELMEIVRGELTEVGKKLDGERTDEEDDGEQSDQ